MTQFFFATFVGSERCDEPQGRLPLSLPVRTQSAELHFSRAKIVARAKKFRQSTPPPPIPSIFYPPQPNYLRASRLCSCTLSYETQTDQFNKLTSVFYTSVLLLMINCVITLSKWLLQPHLILCYFFRLCVNFFRDHRILFLYLAFMLSTFC